MTLAAPTTASPAASLDPTAPSVLVVEDLRVHYETTKGAAKAVEGVSFTLPPGRCLAIVGESGSGKSVTARSLVGLAGQGAVPGSIIGVCMSRGGDLLAAILGVLEIGAAYMPIDRSHPPARLALMLGLGR